MLNHWKSLFKNVFISINLIRHQVNTIKTVAQCATQHKLKRLSLWKKQRKQLTFTKFSRNEIMQFKLYSLSACCWEVLAMLLGFNEALFRCAGYFVGSQERSWVVRRQHVNCMLAVLKSQVSQTRLRLHISVSSLFWKYILHSTICFACQLRHK